MVVLMFKTSPKTGPMVLSCVANKITPSDTDTTGKTDTKLAVPVRYDDDLPIPDADLPVAAYMWEVMVKKATPATGQLEPAGTHKVKAVVVQLNVKVDSAGVIENDGGLLTLSAMGVLSVATMAQASPVLGLITSDVGAGAAAKVVT